METPLAGAAGQPDRPSIVQPDRPSIVPGPASQGNETPPTPPPAPEEIRLQQAKRLAALFREELARPVLPWEADSALVPDLAELLRLGHTEEELANWIRSADRDHAEEYRSFRKTVATRPRTPVIPSDESDLRRDEGIIVNLQRQAQALEGNDDPRLQRRRQELLVTIAALEQSAGEKRAKLSARQAAADAKEAAELAVTFAAAASETAAAADKRARHSRPISGEQLLMTNYPAQRFAIRDIVPEGLTIFAGKPKMGKSWIALNWALAVASGGLALGRFLATYGEVLYLALEDTERRLKDRLLRVAQGDKNLARRVHFTCDWPRQDKGGLTELAIWLEAHPETRLVVIDTWPRFRSERLRGRDAYEEDYEHSVETKWLAEKYHVAIVLVVHCRKMADDDPFSEIAGSIGVSAAPDALLVFRRKRAEKTGTLHVTGRDVPELALSMSWEERLGLWKADGPAAEVPTLLGTEIMHILRREGRPLSPGELAAFLGKGRDAVKKLLRRMLNAKHVERVSGRYWLVQ